MHFERNKYGKIIWTKEAETFVKKNHSKLTNQQLADKLGLKLTKVREKCYEMGLYRMELEYWTKEQVDFVRAYYTIMGDTEIAELFDQMYPKKKGWSKKHIEKKRRYLKLKRSEYQRENIRVRNRKMGRWSIHHYKRWAGKLTAEGTHVIWRIGEASECVMVKWSGGSFQGGYEKLATINWVLHFGRIPKGMNLVHIDGNQRNCDVENLELLTNAELAKKNSITSSQGLSDNYVAGMITHKQKQLRDKLPKSLIEFKRTQLLIDRKIRHHEKQAQ